MIGEREIFYLRDEVANAVLDLGEQNNRVVFVSANVMSSCRVGDSKKRFPDRVFEVGIAEQTMVSFAAGLAKEGLKPYIFTMAPFMSMRACEQVRTDVAYNKLDVKMFAPYAGVSGGISGATHWAIEDCAIMGGIPKITILEPSDPVQAQKMVLATETWDGPVYMRIGIEGVPQIYSDDYDFKIGKADTIIDGEDGTFICSGVTVKYAIEASSRILKECGKKIRVIDMHTIKPIDRDAVLKAAKTNNVVVAQDHNTIGGLGSMVASVIVESGCQTRFKVLGIPDDFVVMGHAPYLYHKYAYDSEGLYVAMCELLDKEDAT